MLRQKIHPPGHVCVIYVSTFRDAGLFSLSCVRVMFVLYSSYESCGVSIWDTMKRFACDYMLRWGGVVDTGIVLQRDRYGDLVGEMCRCHTL